MPLFAVTVAPVAPPQIRPAEQITRSRTFSGGEFLLPSKETTVKAGQETIPQFDGSLVIRGKNLIVDFGGAVLRGTPATTLPDARKGLGIRVIGSNITIKNVRVHGYKVGLLAENVPGLKLVNCDFSNNYKPRLRSTVEREDLSDWMSYHHNENNEWLRYGAAIYLRNCDRFVVTNTRSRGGQNALMLSGCDYGKAWNNDFSFNSGIGLGMYRSSNNRLMHNRIDWCVRGFSYGVYNRGQDSAGILIFEQCNQNVFAYNSVTHGGDGFFLWAGQTTMDSGRGGCNDNLLYGNDFSHAPTNGIEATFSRNAFVNNRVDECAHGVWGGYSYDTVIAANHFADNQAAIAIEHGQRNDVQYNTFLRDDVAISLWSNPSQDPNWGYGKYHETESTDNRIFRNLFLGNGVAYDQRRTTRTKLEENYTLGVGQTVRTPPGELTVPNGAFQEMAQVADLDWNAWRPMANFLAKYQVPPMRGGHDPFLAENALRGWKYILVDDWGPYDFQRPLLWPERLALTGDAPRPGANSAQGSGRKKPTPPTSTGKPRYEILGPTGKWRLVKAEGAKLSATSGTVPGFVQIELEPGRVGTTKVELEYTGAATTDFRGVVTPAGKPVRFGFEKFNAPIDWNVRIFPWVTSTDPKEPHSVPESTALRDILAGKPIAESKSDRLDFASNGSFLPGAPTNRFATVADGSFQIPTGDYTLDVLADDGIRIWVDGKLVLDEWHYQAPTPYTVPLHLGGKHQIRVEHFEIDGYSALKVGLLPRTK